MLEELGLRDVGNCRATAVLETKFYFLLDLLSAEPVSAILPRSGVPQRINGADKKMPRSFESTVPSLLRSAGSKSVPQAAMINSRSVSLIRPSPSHHPFGHDRGCC